ncbi:RuBisCO-associated protein [Glycine soja]|uniref:RuBisCO-associated protein n=1 Tax=Glycine soja TaxID=3848 RepID=A0A445IDI6_GLYSO|nr:ruBisCO-associated protein-like [Glycine soja]RZB84111.1 RuBisCO-associated protein [Glycine soja]
MMSIFRQYTLDDSFSQVLVSPKFLKEYQIALTFASDYDDDGVPTNGVFRPTWDLTKVTPESITRFKDKNPDVDIKVFISIGNRGTQHPFKPLNNQTWIQNATMSLTSLINNLHVVHGIDVLYDHIDASPADFTECVGQLIRNLKENGVVSQASISPSSYPNQEYYPLLYSSVPFFVDWVDYQFQSEDQPVLEPTTLVKRYNELTKVYPKTKLFAGYSAENEDWATVSPFVFFLGAMDLLKKRSAPGVSIHYHNYYASEAPNKD